MRLARRWNQTGQKFAGAPDIARTFLSEHTNILWILVGATYLWNLNSLVNATFSLFGQLIGSAVGAVLITAALTFKLAFTQEDSPELLSGIMKSFSETNVGISLVIRARLIFIGILISVLYTLVTGLSNKKRPNREYRIHPVLPTSLTINQRHYDQSMIS
jgi:ethanolamine phosphate transferase 2 subunit G